MRIRYLLPVLLEANFEHIVGEIALDFAADVHNIETQDCTRCDFERTTRRQGNGVRTVARDSGEGNVHVNGELLASTPVDDDRGVDIDPSVVEELY